MAMTKEERYEKQKLYKLKPSAILRRKEYDRIRQLTPEYKEKLRLYRNTPEAKIKQKIASKKYRSRPEFKELRKKYRTNDRARAIRRDGLLKKKFGISLEDYNILLKSQSEVCAICFQKEVFVKKEFTWSLAVDHDHKTGKVRGLLCRMCNQMLGLVKDDKNILENAISYLTKHNV